MKIELELPEWAASLIEDGRDVYLYAGIESVARKLYGKPWEIKVVRCALCGKCCVDCECLVEKPGYKQPNGKWAMMCNLGEARPHNCSKIDGPEEFCSIRWDIANTK